ncbi:TatD family hydrolase [Alphaproteobacteria bacterium]|nr:TatD family hydrolase [Alphaproteobacteria bacterium]
MKLIDTHCHLDFETFSEDLEEIINRARSVGVTKMITISTKLSNFPKLLNLASEYDGVSCSIGVHPHEAGEEGRTELSDILKYTSHPNVVGIGETGLDYYYDTSNSKLQMESFLTHIDAARTSKLPIIIHSRDADLDMISVLEKEYSKGAFTGVLHCFTGSYALAQKAIELGFYISISGIITFKNSQELVSTVKKIPLTNLLVETDAPYLAPVPFRGKRNEPAYVIKTHEKLAEIMGISNNQFAQITTKNAKTLFSKITDHDNSGRKD